MSTGSFNDDFSDYEEQPIGTAVTTNDSVVEGAHMRNAEDNSNGQLQSPVRERPHHAEKIVKAMDFDSTGDNSGMDVGEEWKARQESMLKGVVDLSHTVDTDRETTRAPGKSLYSRYSRD